VNWGAPLDAVHKMWAKCAGSRSRGATQVRPFRERQNGTRSPDYRLGITCSRTVLVMTIPQQWAIKRKSYSEGLWGLSRNTEETRNSIPINLTNWNYPSHNHLGLAVRRIMDQKKSRHHSDAREQLNRINSS